MLAASAAGHTSALPHRSSSHADCLSHQAYQHLQPLLVAQSWVAPHSPQAERAPLAELKQYQDRISLKDDVAEEALQEAARVKLERLLDSALECVKRRGRSRNLGPAMQVGAGSRPWTPSSIALACSAYDQACWIWGLGRYQTV